MNDWLILVLYVLAVMRLTRLINFDTIMDWLHVWVGNHLGPNHWVAEFLTCPWCVGMWVSIFTAWVPLLFFGFPNWGLYAAMYVVIALAASMITGLMAGLSSEDTALDPK
jgi:hypothetical protein